MDVKICQQICTAWYRQILQKLEISTNFWIIEFSKLIWEYQTTCLKTRLVTYLQTSNIRISEMEKQVIPVILSKKDCIIQDHDTFSVNDEYSYIISSINLINTTLKTIQIIVLVSEPWEVN